MTSRRRKWSTSASFTPVLRLLAKAGWQPVTGVETGDPAGLAERQEVVLHIR